jgi:hypothetical protein
VVIPTLRLLADTFAGDPDVLGASIDGDRVALHVSSARTEATSHAPPTDVVVTFAADGSTSTFQLAVGWAPATRTLARAADGHFGLVVVRGDRATFVATDGTVAPARVAAGCRAPRP